MLARLGEWPLLGQVDVTAEAIAEGAVLGLRAAVVMVAFAVYSACVDPDRVLRALRPLAGRSALTATLVSRLVPVAAADAARLRDAAPPARPRRRPGRPGAARPAPARRLPRPRRRRRRDPGAARLRPRRAARERRGRTRLAALALRRPLLRVAGAAGARGGDRRQARSAPTSFHAYPTIESAPAAATVALAACSSPSRGLAPLRAGGRGGARV